MINGTILYMFFGVKESDAIDILVIRGQLLPQRSPKGHLRSFLQKFPSAGFSWSFSNFCFYYPLGSIKHKKLAAQFFWPPSVFFWPLENRKPPKIGKKSGSNKIINCTTLYMFLGSRNLIQSLFWWSEVNFCHKGHLKVN